MGYKLLDGKWNLYIEENNKCRDYAFDIVEENQLLEKGLKPIIGKVPGNFELDMQNAGLIDEPFFGNNPYGIQELENRHLWYATTFSYNGEFENPYFRFEGVDTFADIYLNGEKIGHTDNMLIPFEFCANSIKYGENEFLVHIYPIFLEARKHILNYDTNSYQKYMQDSLYIRKPAHCFGWDIMPRVLSGGIWKSVKIIEKKNDRIEELYLYTKQIENGKATIVGNYSFNLSDDFCSKYSFKIKGVCGESEFLFELDRLWNSSGLLTFCIDATKLWWPKNAGEQNLYSVKAELLFEGKTVDTKLMNFGVRTIELIRTDTVEDENANFLFKVNGTPIYMMGTNWLPLDAFHSRESERLAKSLELLGESKCNMVRCWGGNAYPDKEFFDFCDKNGILVWQDFAMGCASYPQDEFFLNTMKKEVETVVKTYRGFTSLALWAGDNECDLARAAWFTQTFAPSDNIITRKLIPDILSKLDPNRIYLPSSPYISDKIYESKMKLAPAEDHIWGPRDYFKNPYYFTAQAYFASEIGYHGSPCVKSIKKFISNDKLFDCKSDEWLAHATCAEPSMNSPYAYRIELMFTQIKFMFGNRPEKLQDFVIESQICQAEAMKFFVESFRSKKWRKTGLIWWNLVDGWPQFSDAVIDYYYNKKAAFEYIKRSQEPLCLMFKEPENEKLTLVAVNDFLEDKSVPFTVEDANTSEVILNGNATVTGNSVVEIGDIPFGNKTHIYIIKWKVDDKEYLNHYLSGKAPYNLNEYLTLIKCAEFDFNAFWKV